MIAVGRREGYCCRLHRRNGDNDSDDDESESLFKSYTNVVPLRNLAQAERIPIHESSDFEESTQLYCVTNLTFAE